MEKRKKEKRENGEKLESEVKENGSTYQKMQRYYDKLCNLYLNEEKNL